MKIKIALFISASLLLSLIMIQPIHADEIWSIGQEDQTASEFAVSENPYEYLDHFPEDVDYIIGESKPSEDWVGIQPGPGDNWGGSRSNKFNITFDIPKVDSEGYVLKIRILAYHPNQPLGLNIEVNDTPYTIHFPPGGHQDAWRNYSLAEPFHFDFIIPNEDITEGKNTLTISTLSNWVVWDSLSLHDSADAKKTLAVDEVKFNVLPFFVRSNDGLKQQARVSFLLPVNAESLHVRLGLNNEQYSQDLQSNALGYVSYDLSIPEIEDEGEAKVEIFEENTLLAEKSISVQPSRKWTISVVPQAHVDIGYTHLQPEAMEIHRDSNDKALELLDDYPDFVWSVESSYVMEEWMESRPEEMIKHFFHLARNKRLEVEAFYGNLLTGLLSDEEAFRSLYFSKKMSRKYDIPFASATLTDAPSHIWSVPTILRKSGVKYLSMGINSTRGKILRGGLYERSPIWWQGPDGSKVLAYFHDHYAGAGAIGLTDAWSGEEREADLTEAERRIPALLESYDRPSYPYDSIHIHGAYGDNRPLTEQLPKTVEAWNEKYAYPKIVFTTNTEWFSTFEEKYGEQVDTISGDGGAYWEDGAGSSAHETILNRYNQQDALLAEMLLTGLHAQGEIQEDYRDMFADLWHKILLYNEHTWGAHNSVSQPQKPEVLNQYKIKAQFAHDAHVQARSLLEIARKEIENNAEANRDMTIEDNIIASPKYKITIDTETGGLSSILDRDNGKELIDQDAPYQLGTLIYARNNEPPYDFTTSTFQRIEHLDNEVKIYSTHEVFPEIVLTLTLDNTQELIEFQYDLEKKYRYDKEGVYIAFPFAGNNPQIDYAVANAVVRAGQDWLPGACKDWFTLQNWLRVRNQDQDVLFITYDAPLISLQDINPNKWLTELPIENGHVYGYIMNNYWFTNYKAGQAGHFTFRFALHGDGEIPFAKAARLGRDWTLAERETMDSMLTAKPDNVLISGFKRAEFTEGYVVRLREMSGKSTTANLQIPAIDPITKVELCNGVEDPIAELEIENGVISVDLKPWDVVTLKVQSE